MNIITVSLDYKSDKPLYQQLYEYIKKEIINGSFKSNSKLPSKRCLASYLQCSQNTIQTAYGQLLSEGYITSRQRSGYYVCALDGILNIKNECEQSITKSENKNEYKYEFSYDGVDFDSFPFSVWRKILKDSINEYDYSLLKAGNPQGDESLRESITNYLHNSRGVNCTAERIIVSSGTEFLLQLLIQLFDDDYIYAIENPGYQKLNMIFKSSRAQYRAVSLDEYGIMPDELIKSRADVVCITPSHQFPTGTIMPVNRRIALLNWAGDNSRRYIIEDDYDSEFKYAGRPIPSLQGLDTSDKVIYIGSFSKSLTPSIRISYMVLPRHLIGRYYEKLSFYICPVPAAEQKALNTFFSDGHFERHLNKMRNIYKAKREALVSEVNNLMPDVRIEGANAGLHIVLNIRNGMNEQQLITAAKNEGIKVFGLSQYYFNLSSKNSMPCVLLGFATLKIDEISKAVELLKKAWRI